MDKTYYELSITPSDAYSQIIDFIFSLGFDAVEERDGTIILRTENSPDMLLFGLEELKKRLSTFLDKEISLNLHIEEKENRDWIKEYQNSIKPIEIGSFYIRPQWEDKIENKIDIQINPALAFGSGHHETTSSCIEVLEKYIDKNASLLDVGCGSGILSIASAKLGAVVDICDTDELAIKSAKENFELNGVSYNKAWVGSVDKRDKEYDIVVANIIADVLIMLSRNLKETTKSGGILILSGILDKYIDKVEEKFQDMKILEKKQKNEWYTLVLKR